MNPVSARHWAVIPAAGKGARMGAEIPKQYLRLGAQTIIEHTLRRFTAHPGIAGVVVAVAEDDEIWPTLVGELPPLRVTPGGRERCHSVLNALDALADVAAADDWVLVHDAARPCLHASDIARLLEAAVNAPRDEGCILAMPVRDTLKRCAADGLVEDTVDRTRLWHALTPQMFRFAQLQRALRAALSCGALVTDEAQAVELAGGRVRVVEGRGDNVKVTRPGDLVMAELFLQAQAKEST